MRDKQIKQTAKSFQLGSKQDLIIYWFIAISTILCRLLFGGFFCLLLNSIRAHKIWLSTYAIDQFNLFSHFLLFVIWTNKTHNAVKKKTICIDSNLTIISQKVLFSSVFSSYTCSSSNFSMIFLEKKLGKFS